MFCRNELKETIIFKLDFYLKSNFKQKSIHPWLIGCQEESFRFLFTFEDLWIGYCFVEWNFRDSQVILGLERTSSNTSFFEFGGDASAVDGIVKRGRPSLHFNLTTSFLFFFFPKSILLELQVKISFGEKVRKGAFATI